MAKTTSSITQLLHAWRAGDQQALPQLMPLIYDELHRRAQHYMRAERADHTLQTTALINEAYLNLVDMRVDWQDRVHFFAVAARLMRRILIDHAKSKYRDKRGAGAIHVSLENALQVAAEPADGLLELDDALTRLAALDERKAQLVELHYFGGLHYDEMAAALAISPATVDRDLRFAKAWLYREMRGSAA